MRADDAKTQDFRVLCAASGDLRNVVKTASGLMDDYEGKCEIVVHDLYFDIVARNAILLMIALFFDNIEEAVPVMIHLWYSARMPATLLAMIQDKLLPPVEDVCNKIANKSDDIPLGKTFKTHSGQSLRIVLTKAGWSRFKSYFTMPAGLTPKAANTMRLKAVYDPSRRDYLHKGFYTYWRTLRVSMDKFRQDGILLPYGSSRADFDTWNPTFLQTPGLLSFRDDVDPHAGWSHEQIISGAPKAMGDYLGAQFFMLRALLTKFCERVRKINIQLRMYSVDTLDLPIRLAHWKEEVGLFDRVEMTNVCDRIYIRPGPCISTYAPLLKPTPHAILLLLFMMNAVPEIDRQSFSTEALGSECWSKNPTQYMSVPDFDKYDAFEKRWHPDIERFQGGAEMLRDFEVRFERYVADLAVKEMLAKKGLRIRDVGEHTVTRAWPAADQQGGG